MQNLRNLAKSRIFKNLNLRAKADHNFRRNLLENCIRHLNYIQILQAYWPKVDVIWAPFEKQKAEVYIFERANFSGYAKWKFTTQEDVNS